MKIAIAVGVLSLAGLAGISAVLEEPQESKRLVYDAESGIPDSVMLPLFLLSIAQSKSESEHDERHHGVMRVRRELSIDDYGDAAAVFDYLSLLSDQLEHEKKAFFRNTICPFDRPRPSGEAFLALLNEYDEQNDVLGDRYLARIEAHLPKATYDLFLRWMDKQKSGTLIVRVDHVATRKNDDPDFLRQDLCGRFDLATANE